MTSKRVILTIYGLVIAGGIVLDLFFEHVFNPLKIIYEVSTLLLFLHLYHKIEEVKSKLDLATENRTNPKPVDYPPGPVG